MAFHILLVFFLGTLAEVVVTLFFDLISLFLPTPQPSSLSQLPSFPVLQPFSSFDSLSLVSLFLSLTVISPSLLVLSSFFPLTALGLRHTVL